MEDATRQPGVRAERLMRRDLSVDDPRTDAAAVVIEATAHGLEFTLVQLLMLPIAMLSHVYLPLLKEGAIPSHVVVVAVSQAVRGDCDARHGSK